MQNANWRFGGKNMNSNLPGWSIGEIRLIGEISCPYLLSTEEKNLATEMKPHRKAGCQLVVRWEKP